MKTETAKMPTVELKVRSNKLTALIKALSAQLEKKFNNSQAAEISELYKERLDVDLELFDRKIKDLNLIQ